MREREIERKREIERLRKRERGNYRRQYIYIEREMSETGIYRDHVV